MLDRIIFLSAAMLVASSALASDGRIANKQAFINQIVGKKISFPNGAHFIFSKNGKWSGGNKNISGSGKWYWENGRLCRTGKWAGKELPLDCQEYYVVGNEVAYVRDYGKGSFVTGQFAQ
ncbi:hypothetical protein [Marimonas lutisalis]|uniref:hypothetical protein n=1 Tax=Marimonas lutisalis TaxID=2545756 RepID=UPI0010F52E25|nr:hypothetical protein [Marimonas lutisalis]